MTDDHSAARRPNPGNRVQMRIPYGLDNNTLNLLHTHFQQYYFITDPNPIVHPHPCLAVERLLAENYVYDCARKLSKGETIVDIGGAPKRHLKLIRLDVHSCCPLMEPADVLRHSELSSVEQTMCCSHYVQECDCVEPAIFMAIHSLYYLTPSDVLKLLDRCTTHSLIAAVHHFPDYFGVFYGGEAEYQLNGEQVNMKVKHNAQQYRHNALHWVKASDYYEGHGKAMAWSIMTVINNTHVYKFTSSPILQRQVHSPGFDLPEVVKDQGYYGKVLVGMTNPNANIVSTALAKQSILIDRMFSVGKFLVFNRLDSIELPIPKGLVHELATYIALKPRNESTFATLTERSKLLIRNYNYPVELKPTCVIVATVTAFNMNLSMEIGILNRMNLSRGHLSQRLDKLLKGSSETSSFISRTLLGQYWYLAAMLVSNVPKENNTEIVTQGFKNFNITHESFLMSRNLVAYVSPIPLIGRLCNNAMAKTKIGSKLKMLDECARSKIDYILYGVGFCNRIPIVYGSNGHNERNSLNNRALMDTPQVDSQEFTNFRVFVETYFDEIFLDWQRIDKFSYTAWNNSGNFNVAKRLAHDKARELYRSGFYNLNNSRDMSNITVKKTFVKREKLCIGDLVPDDKDVRTIQGCTDIFNVIVGPFVRAFQLQIKRIWDSTHFCFSTSGRSANEIGAWFDNFGHNNPNYVYCEDDFSRFDASISRDMLELEIDIMKRFGLPQDAEQVLRAAISTHGYTMRGNFYSVDGTRHSGDPQTSVGNTIINMLVHLYALFSILGDHHAVFQNVNMVAVGDDNLIVMDRLLLNDPDILRIPTILRKLGLNSVFQIRQNSHFVEYCSARFWPALVGSRLLGDDQALQTHILGPKIGRVLQKLGYFIDGQSKLPVPLLVGTALGLKDDVAHIPILADFVGIPLRIHGDRYRPILDKHKSHVSSIGKAHEATYVMIEDLYGLTNFDVVTIRNFFASILQLPAVSYHELLTRVFEVDCD